MYDNESVIDILGKTELQSSSFKYLFFHSHMLLLVQASVYCMFRDLHV